MLNVALTGNIASGKSTVAGLFRAWGATLIDELWKNIQERVGSLNDSSANVLHCNGAYVATKHVPG